MSTPPLIEPLAEPLSLTWIVSYGKNLSYKESESDVATTSRLQGDSGGKIDLCFSQNCRFRNSACHLPNISLLAMGSQDVGEKIRPRVFLKTLVPPWPGPQFLVRVTQ